MEVSGRKLDDSDLFCGLCKAVEDITIADSYCVECDEFLCHWCTRAHRGALATRRHALLDKQDMPKKKLTGGNFCTVHDKLFDFHCITHDELCCDDCVLTSHKHCNLDNIKDFEADFQNSQEYQTLFQRIKNIQRIFQDIREKSKENSKTIQSCYDKLLFDIRDFRDDVNEILDSLENVVVKQSMSSNETDKQTIFSVSTTCESLTAEIDEIDEIFQNQIKYKLNHHLVLTSRKVQKQVSRLEMRAEELKEENQIGKYKFERNKVLVDVLQSLTSLGTIKDERMIQMDKDDEENRICVVCEDQKGGEMEERAIIEEKGKEFLVTLSENTDDSRQQDTQTESRAGDRKGTDLMEIEGSTIKHKDEKLERSHAESTQLELTDTEIHSVPERSHVESTQSELTDIEIHSVPEQLVISHPLQDSSKLDYSEKDLRRIDSKTQDIPMDIPVNKEPYLENLDLTTEASGIERQTKGLPLIRPDKTGNARSPKRSGEETKDAVARKNDKFATFKLRKKIDVQYSKSGRITSFKQEWTCHISGCVKIDAHRLVVVDTDNSSIKLLDLNTDKIISYRKLQGDPFGITRLSHDLLVVTCNEKLVFLNQQLSIKKQLKLNGDCLDITYSDNKFYVTFRYPESAVKILTIEGNVLKSFTTDKYGHKLFNDPLYITLSVDKQNMIVIDCSPETVTSLTMEGHVNFIYKHDRLWAPRGITVDNDVNIYIAGGWSHNIHQITSQGQLVQIIEVERDGVDYPRSLTWCNHYKQLYIGRHDNHISVYQSVHNQEWQ